MAGQRRVGRPPKDPAEKLGERVMVNLTQAEAAALRKAAGEEPLGSYLRRLVVRHLRAKGGRR
jgi:hypothetical protein